MNKKNKKPRKSIKEELQESSRMIDQSIAFWEEQMDVVIKKMDEAEEYPDWHPEKTEETPAEGEVPAEGATEGVEDSAKAEEGKDKTAKSPDDKTKTASDDKTKAASSDKSKAASKETKKK